MSRTTRRVGQGRKWWNKEAGWARRITRRLERHRSKNLIQSENYDLAASRQIKPTEGWITS